ncbi:MAG: Zn-ribbon domain-containing OB-fold protein [Promethearchaeati archaeon SRVP18_Atabeyarchaeia-1]
MTRVYGTEPLTIIKDYRIRYQSTLGEVSKFYLDMANKGKLMGTKCEKCGKTYLPPYPHCPECLGETSWVEVPASGTVEAFTICYAQPRHFTRKLPYVIAYVRLEGVDNLLPGIIESDPSKVEEGAKVALKIRVPEKGPSWGVYESEYHFELVEG